MMRKGLVTWSSFRPRGSGLGRRREIRVRTSPLGFPLLIEAFYPCNFFCDSTSASFTWRMFAMRMATEVTCG